jgi:hypothetical protein
MSKDCYLLFKAEMVRAILSGHKTMTRRILDNVPDGATSAGHMTNSIEGDTGLWSWLSGDPWDCDTWEFLGDFKLPWKLGAIMNGKEGFVVQQCLRYSTLEAGVSVQKLNTCIDYLADGKREWIYDPCSKILQRRTADRKDGKRGAEPSIHMPKEIVRIQRQIIDLKIERLQDITEADALAEGIQQFGRIFGLPDADWDDAALTARDAFSILWDSINGDRKGASWADNPWVVAITFEGKL